MGHTGATAFTRSEAQRFARQIVESESYRTDLQDRAKSGKLAPAVEQMLWYYAYGKPAEMINLNVTKGDDLSSLTVEELQERAKALSDQIDEMNALSDAIPADVVKGPW